MEPLLSEGCNSIKNEINSSNLNTVLFVNPNLFGSVDPLQCMERDTFDSEYYGIKTWRICMLLSSYNLEWKEGPL